MEENDGRAGDWHVTPKLLRALEMGEVDAGVYLTLLMEHVSSLCPTCGEGIRSLVDGGPPAPPEDLAGAPPYDDLIDHAAARTLEYGELEAAARRARAALRVLPTHGDRLRAVRDGAGPGGNPALVELLLEEARSRVHDSPTEAGELAELAEAVALRLGDGAYGRSLCRDLVTEARAHRANALRANGRLKQAEALLADVGRRLRDSYDPFLLAEVASFNGSLAKDQRRFGESLEHLDEAERLFLDIGASSELVARVRLLRANVLGLQGQPDDALAVARQVVEGLGGDDDPDLRFIARHNLVVHLCEAGLYQDARRVLAAMEPECFRHRRRSFDIRTHWRQGEIAHGLGEHQAAETKYLRARDEFLVAGLGYDAALVALDLATLYLEQGRNAEVRQLALWTSTLFETQDVHREALAALALFRRAALEDALTVAELRRLSRHVATLRHGAALEPVS